jgi:hypothetical protein
MIQSVETLFEFLRPYRAVRPRPGITLTEHSYLPKTTSPYSDWVVRVAIPAFQAICDEMKGSQRSVRSFCTIGTGTGTDALAAIEIFNPNNVVVTDIHPDVVAQAVLNIRKNLPTTHKISIEGISGPLCRPLMHRGMTFDLIYENLPNLEPTAGTDVLADTNAASFFPVEDISTTTIPTAIRQDLLSSHFICLKEAQPCLATGGTILCSIGGRRPVNSLLAMAHHAGYHARILTYTWKIQSEAELVIQGYAMAQQLTGVTFFFYPVDALRHIFDGLLPEIAGRHVVDIERALAPWALDADMALRSVRQGRSVGHTVAVLAGVVA